MNELTTESLEALAEEIKSTIVETQFVASSTVINGHHGVGALMHEYINTHKIPATLLVKQLNEREVAGETTLWLCHDFYEKYPKLDEVYALLGEKAASWNKVRKLLKGQVEKGEKPPCNHSCPHHCK